jgi:hypothetical protein
MKALIRPTLIAMACLAMGSAGLGQAESVFVTATAAGGNGTSASVDIRVIVPPVMQVIENSHPTQLGVPVDGQWSARQKLVVHSTMKRGFCVSLRLAAVEVEGWRLRATTQGERSATLQAVADGYRVCTDRAGRYTLVLEHAFATERATSGAAPPPALGWPVRTDLTAL